MDNGLAQDTNPGASGCLCTTPFQIPGPDSGPPNCLFYPNIDKFTRIYSSHTDPSGELVGYGRMALVDKVKGASPTRPFIK
jgi:hypothetical protein